VVRNPKKLKYFSILNVLRQISLAPKPHRANNGPTPDGNCPSESLPIGPVLRPRKGRRVSSHLRPHRRPWIARGYVRIDGTCCGPSATIKNGGSLRFLVLIATGRVRRRMGWWLPRGGRVRHRSAGRVRHATRVDPGLVRRHSYVSLTC
jgi:hypothetical protein